MARQHALRTLAVATALALATAGVGVLGMPSAPAAPAARDGAAARRLEVRIERPAAAADLVKVVVRGPGDYRKVLRRTTVLRDLVPGSYSVAARAIRLYDQHVEPYVLPGHTVRVPGRDDPDGPRVRVVYKNPELCRYRGADTLSWGESDSGRLGVSTSTDRTRPGVITLLRGVVAVTGGRSNGYALCEGGSVWAWGDNGYGQLGNGKDGDRPYPVRVVLGYGHDAVAALDRTGLALWNGTVTTWGWGEYGQLGDGRPWSASRIARRPVDVVGLTDVVAIAGGGYTAYALKSDGTVWAWGNGRIGQLGDGANQDRSTPVQVTGLTDVVQVAAGHDTAYALRSDGTVWAWGNGQQGQLGEGGLTSSNVPVPVSTGGLLATSVGASYAAGYLVAADGTVRAWGSRRHGALGDGTADGSWQTTPLPVPGLAGVLEVLGRGRTAYARLGDGSVWAWGSNSAGQLGAGLAPTGPAATDGVPVPTAVPGLSGVTALGVGELAGYAVR